MGANRLCDVETSAIEGIDVEVGGGVSGGVDAAACCSPQEHVLTCDIQNHDSCHHRYMHFCTVRQVIKSKATRHAT